jgi:hypothetical protein
MQRNRELTQPKPHDVAAQMQLRLQLQMVYDSSPAPAFNSRRDVMCDGHGVPPLGPMNAILWFVVQAKNGECGIVQEKRNEAAHTALVQTVFCDAKSMHGATRKTAIKTIEKCDIGDKVNHFIREQNYIAPTVESQLSNCGQQS